MPKYLEGIIEETVRITEKVDVTERAAMAENLVQTFQELQTVDRLSKLEFRGMSNPGAWFTKMGLWWGRMWRFTTLIIVAGIGDSKLVDYNHGEVG
jgi:hypothetical protein